MKNWRAINTSVWSFRSLLGLDEAMGTRTLLLVAGLLSAVGVGVLTVKFGVVGAMVVPALWLGVIYCIFLYKKPELGLMTILLYGFVLPFFAREFYPIQFGIGIEGLFLITFLATFLGVPKHKWANLSNDLVILTAIWFAISVLQVANPYGGSIVGWFQELRTAGLYGLLVVILAFLLFDTKQHLNIFIGLIVIMSVFASLNGARQLYYGLLPGEQVFVQDNAITHLIWGQLRVFSFFTDAGMFGAMQAHIALVTGVLIFGPFRLWVKGVLAIATVILLYGMLISGTRGSLFVIIFGAFAAIMLFKSYKVLVIGVLAGILALGILKYTHIGSGNYHIYRLRTALDPQDASLNLRFENQQILHNYMKDLPFGGGLGVIGAWGHKYNSDKFLSKVEPDSYWVKVWAMYGIVGLTIWFCMLLYIIGKCAGYIWNIRDQGLRVKLIALMAASIGTFFASYGNEVINRVPALFIVYITWVFVYFSPKWDKPLKPIAKNRHV